MRSLPLFSRSLVFGPSYFLGTMTFLRLSVALLLLSITGTAQLRGQTFLDSLTSDLNIEGLETTYDPVTGLAMAKGDVHVSYSDVEIRCGTASYNANTGEVIARENVIIWKSGITYKGENIIYNANSGDISGDAVRSSLEREVGNFFYETDRFETQTRLVERLEGGETMLTTHDSDQPNYRLRARSMTVYPNDRVVMKNVSVLVGETPVFYLPSVTQSLNGEMGYRFNPGYQSRWGAFLLNEYSVIHGDHTAARYHLDLRSARGLGVGVDFMSTRYRNNWHNFSGLKLYFQSDSQPDDNRTSDIRRPVSDKRYRVNFQHRIYLPGPEKSTWYLDFDLNKISDSHFYEDFFFNDFRETPQPDNQVSLVHTDPRYLATLMARFQLNDFYRVGEKLPEFSVDWTRRPLWDSGIFHQGTFSAGFLREQLSDLDITNANLQVQANKSLLAGLDVALGGGELSDSQAAQVRNLLGLSSGVALGVPEYTRAEQLLLSETEFDRQQYARVHTYHEFLYPKTFGGWLNVVPRLGVGVTHYSGITARNLGVGPERDFADETKGIFHAGLDVSFKLTKTWSDYTNESLGIDGLRHILQPYINVSYLDADRPEDFPSIDRLSKTTRPRSLDLPLYSAIDDLTSWNVTRVGFRNHLQTRRDYTQFYNNGRFQSANEDPSQTYTLAGMNTYVDVFHNDPEFNRSISNLYNELFFRPVPWINIWMDMQLPITSDNGNFTEFNQGITFLPSDSLSLTLGHQYVSDSPYFRDSNLIFSRIYARFNDNWGFAMNHIYEMDDGTMEFQSYSITRDLTSWVASFGAMMRDNRNGQAEMGILLSLTLKDFPNLTLPLDFDPNPSGRGGSQ